MADKVIGTCGTCSGPVREGNGFSVANKGKGRATYGYFHNTAAQCSAALRADEVASPRSFVNVHAGRDAVVAFQLAQFD